MSVCSAKTQKGNPCKGQAITGGRVCRVHGGSAPQVIAAARMRILQAADPAAARLVSIALARGRDKNVEPQQSLVAIRELLNRAGITAAPQINAGAPQINAEGDSGQVLWEEFIQIHRKKVSQE